MKNTLITLALVILITGCTTAPVKADTVVIRQPGLVEAVGQLAVGTVRCVGEMATGLVAGSTTVVQTPNVVVAPGTVAPVAPVAVAPTTVVTPAPVAVAPAVVTTPTVVAPATPLMPYGAYYNGYYGHRIYYNHGYYHYRPCRPYRPYNPYLGGGHWGGLRPGCPCR